MTKCSVEFILKNDFFLNSSSTKQALVGLGQWDSELRY